MSPRDPLFGNRSLPAVAWAERCSYPPRAGNRLRPLIDGLPAFRRICEAVEAAHSSVWVTIAFTTPDFTFPDGRGDVLSFLDRAARRGLDVRAIFWRPNEETARYRPRAFWGSADHLRALAERDIRFQLRWDRALGMGCQHQKSWLIDAGEEAETAFVGGMNLNPLSLADPGHGGAHSHHDAYLEIAGPCATDVRHNFVQRWNQASELGGEDGDWPRRATSDLAYPQALSAERGRTVAQVQRTLAPSRYANAPPPPGARPLPHSEGETSILEQYRAAIRGARRTVYMENQALEVPAIVSDLRDALQRGVRVVVVVPAEPEPFATAPASDRRRAFLEQRASLLAFETFTLAGLAGPGDGGERRPVYVHAKLMIVDDRWATIGSGNVHLNSMYASTEMNVSFAGPEEAVALRTQLFAEHIGEDTSGLDDVKALRRFAAFAIENRLKRERGETDWRGLAFQLDPASLGWLPADAEA